MANFVPAFEKMLLLEGGFVLHKVEGDRGGMTYAGISKKYHPYWPGWKIIDKDPDDPSLIDIVRNFYKEHFWDKVRGDDIVSQKIAQSIFDFSVNTGLRVSTKLAQTVVGVMPDGFIGEKTVSALNKEDEETFILKYTVVKIARYAGICNNDKSQKKFLLGWTNRTLKGLENV